MLTNSINQVGKASLQETGWRPTAALDRNLACLGLVEVLYGYPLTGCLPPGATRRPRPTVNRFVWLPVAL